MASPNVTFDEPGMTKGGKPKDVFDVDHIEKIVQLMERHDLREVDLQQGDDKIRLSRGATAAAASAVPIAAPPSGPPVAAAQSATLHAAPAPASADAAGNMVTINAPMVGTFYARANPIPNRSSRSATALVKTRSSASSKP